MIRKLTIALVVMSALAITAAAALAVGPTSVTQSGGLHFVGSPDLTVQSSGSGPNTEVWLTATGEVAGAGKTATATLSADVEVVRGCINRGSKDQEPSGLKRSFSAVSGTQTFHTRSGRGTFSVSTDPHITAAGFSCPDQMVPTLVSVTFSNITLTITSQTGTTTATFPDQSWPA
jgi:hypothetical protein